MAKVTNLNFCDVCSAEVTYPTPERCAHCGAQLIIPENKNFKAPTYLYYQLKDQTRLAREGAGHIIRPDSTVSKTAVAGDAEMAVIENYRKWLEECPDGDRLAAASDTFDLLKHTIFSGLKSDYLMAFIKKCIQIGKLAETIDQYVKQGGHTHGRSITDAALRNSYGASNPTEGQGY